MLLDVQPVPFHYTTEERGGAETRYVDNDGRMQWNVGPNQQTRFLVTMNTAQEPPTWQCECAQGRRPRPINATVCDHVEAACKFWMNAEARKRQLNEQVAQHAAERTREFQERSAELERQRMIREQQAAAEREIQQATKPVAPALGFVVKVRRSIKIEE